MPTVYLKIPKESAANKITKKYDYRSEHKGDKIIVKNPNGHRRATIKDCKVKSAEVETTDGKAESGKIGSEMNYKNSRGGKKCRKAVSEYEF